MFVGWFPPGQVLVLAAGKLGGGGDHVAVAVAVLDPGQKATERHFGGSVPGLGLSILVDEALVGDFVHDEAGVLGPFGLAVLEFDADQGEPQ